MCGKCCKNAKKRSHLPMFDGRPVICLFEPGVSGKWSPEK